MHSEKQIIVIVRSSERIFSYKRSVKLNLNQSKDIRKGNVIDVDIVD
jgi:hypothetical protein|tara:strand:+ start:162 stop:302 length:141 start_codon:yes stop_codon:yes gene_type:complete